ncbi:hypothetical protein BHF71_08145 [Vulcanibacillus modesticaldus]|uniref:Uncharacterized protein n=1 Tax=Vulcanibacillus modesticaldus TaxID=337097 RepID=A0A1D2YVG5_9BACI|nr:pro-sigmaK processing inhibitor BofA family protein [Vulcanibacillus modesticaldus]OEF99647.1 hypothetical protein BHF71_08145 [Vulcanibacillus modesticaldus]
MENLDILWWIAILFIGIVIIVFLGDRLIKIVKLGWIGILKIAVGAFLLYFFNIIGQIFNIYIPLNMITSSVVGFLGIPGLASLIIIKLFII